MEAISAVAIEVEDLDDVRPARGRLRSRAARPGGAAEKLRIAYEWCVRHPATSDTGAATWGDAGLPGLSDCDASLGGDGTRRCAAFVAEELGAAMGVSTQSAMSLMARCPRPAAPVPAAVRQGRGPRGGAVQDPPGRRGHPLASLRGGPVGRRAARRPRQRLRHPDHPSGWSPSPPPGSRPRSRPRRSRPPSPSGTSPSPTRGPGEFAGTSWLEAAGDTQDLTAFYALVCAEAKQLGRLGDTDDYEARKAKALGIIAARQGALEFTDQAPDGRQVTRRPVQTNLYVHVSFADLATHLGRRPGRRVRSRSSAPPPST